MPRPWARPLRIALFTDTFDEISGVGHTFRLLCEHCRRRRVELDVFTVASGETSCEAAGNVTIHRLKPRLPLNYYPGLYFDLIPLDDTILATARERDFDVIHVATPGHMGLTGLYLSVQLSRPLVGSYHTELPAYVSQRLTRYLGAELADDDEAREYVGEVSAALTWDYLACFYNHCALVLAPSQFTREQLAERLQPPLELFPRGVDTEFFTPARRQRTDGARRALYVGRLAVEKNLDWLVAFGRRHPEIELVIVGDGPERERLAAALPRARFTGFLRGEALAREYADADVFAFPSLTETFGNVVLEAQSSGLPAVVGDRGGPREIIEPQVTGLVADSAETFEAHLLALLTDDQRRRAYGAAARERARQRSWDEVFDQLLGRWAAAAWPGRRKLWRRFLRRLNDSDSPWAVGLVAFWKQFGRRRAQRRSRARPLLAAERPEAPEETP